MCQTGTERGTRMRFWTVTCTDFHHCIGPLTSKSLATMVALLLTEQGAPDGCVYVPVRMEFLGQAVEIGSPEALEEFQRGFEKGKRKREEINIGGQYL
jgi:hypothetical protein